MRPEERPAERVERDLRARLDSGEWASGDQLPTVAALAQEYGVSQGTVARVVARLAEAGHVRTVRAWGIFKT